MTCNLNVNLTLTVPQDLLAVVCQAAVDREVVIKESKVRRTLAFCVEDPGGTGSIPCPVSPPKCFTKS